MSYSKNTWNQLKNTTVEQLIKAMEKDGWVRSPSQGATLPFVHPDREYPVVIHYHPKKTYGASLLKGLIADLQWSESDLKRLKLIK